MRKLATIALVALALAAAPHAAQAAPITGSIGFGGGFTPTSSTGGTSTLQAATGVHFVAPIIVTSPRTGDYASVTPGTIAAFSDFSFKPASAPPAPPITPLWTFVFGGRTYSFDLATVAVVDQDKTFLSLKGTGTLHITGLDDTEATWSFTGTKQGGSFSFGSAAAAAPEPASIMMLGLGFLGTARAVRRRWSL